MGATWDVDVVRWVQKNPNIFFLGSQGAEKAETKRQTVLTTLVHRPGQKISTHPLDCPSKWCVRGCRFTLAPVHTRPPFATPRSNSSGL
jgi:hypothetical protein